MAKDIRWNAKEMFELRSSRDVRFILRYFIINVWMCIYKFWGMWILRMLQIQHFHYFIFNNHQTSKFCGFRELSLVWPLYIWHACTEASSIKKSAFDASKLPSLGGVASVNHSCSCVSCSLSDTSQTFANKIWKFYADDQMTMKTSKICT